MLVPLGFAPNSQTELPQPLLQQSRALHWEEYRAGKGEWEKLSQGQSATDSYHDKAFQIPGRPASLLPQNRRVSSSEQKEHLSRGALPGKSDYSGHTST